MKPHATNGNHPRVKTRGWLFLAGLLCGMTQLAWANPFIPSTDSQVLADLPLGSRHTPTAARDLSRSRVDVALPLAQFYITRARATGDLRYLGYAEGTLAPWLKQSPVRADVLVLDATISQSRHNFNYALTELDRALKLQPDNPQAWLTRATVLRVLGRYDESLSSCAHLAAKAGPDVTALCEESLRGLSGHLQTAYTTIQALPMQSTTGEERAWQCSELGEMAERLGNDSDAERWFRKGLATSPGDFYVRAALSDLLLRQGRAKETLELLSGYESMEPMLLRLTLAHQALGDSQGEEGRALLSNAFDVEQQRGEAVHRREQARYLLDIERQPEAALAAAQQNWSVQREPEDVLILLRSAQGAHQPDAAKPALKFIQQQKLEDVRLDKYTGNSR